MKIAKIGSEDLDKYSVDAARAGLRFKRWKGAPLATSEAQGKLDVAPK